MEIFIIHCCFTSTWTVWIIRDREPRMSTSAFTQLLSFVTEISVSVSVSVSLSVSLSLSHFIYVYFKYLLRFTDS